MLKTTSFSYPPSCNLFPLCYTNCYGALAQLGARHIRIVEVVSSNLICSIFSMIDLSYIPAKAMTAITSVMTVIFYNLNFLFPFSAGFYASYLPSIHSDPAARLSSMIHQPGSPVTCWKPTLPSPPAVRCSRYLLEAYSPVTSGSPAIEVRNDASPATSAVSSISVHAVSLKAPMTSIEPATCAIVLTARITAAFNHFFVSIHSLNTQFFGISCPFLSHSYSCPCSRIPCQTVDCTYSNSCCLTHRRSCEVLPRISGNEQSHALLRTGSDLRPPDP